MDESARGLDDRLEGAIGSQCGGRDVVWKTVRGRRGLEGVIDGGEVPIGEEFEDAFASAGVPELLETAPDLLRCPTLAGDMEDVVRDESVPVWKTAQGPGRTRCFWTISVEGFDESGLEVRRPYGFTFSF